MIVIAVRMNEIFDLVYKFLTWISSVAGLTYREVNIIVYFILIPSFIFYLISRKFKTYYPVLIFLTIVVVALMVIPDFELFSDELFDKSVDFLNWFEIIGFNYVQASVVICVLFPILIFAILSFIKLKSSTHD